MYELSMLPDYCLNGQAENTHISMHLITFVHVNGVLLVREFVISTYNGNGSFYVFSTHVSGFLDGSQSRGNCKL